jgi:rare lipoprotein A
LYARFGVINQETRKMMVRLGAAVGARMFVICSSMAMSATQSENQKQNSWNAVASGPTIVGVASTYNPYRHDQQSGGSETASGESYDPNAWTAAIHIGFRKEFGGVHYGRDYRPAYALVVTADKQAIVKINDVGPLEPGRVIDFNERTMRYFDPSFKRGLIYRVKVTPLRGDDWAPGPVTANG